MNELFAARTNGHHGRPDNLGSAAAGLGAEAQRNRNPIIGEIVRRANVARLYRRAQEALPPRGRRPAPRLRDGFRRVPYQYDPL